MTPMRGRCFHGVQHGCAYCRAITIADDGPDPDDRDRDHTTVVTSPDRGLAEPKR